MGPLRIFVWLLGPHRRGEGMDERSDINPSFIKTIPCKLLLRREVVKRQSPNSYRLGRMGRMTENGIE